MTQLAYIPGRTIAITTDMVARWGADAAILLQQVAWTLANDPTAVVQTDDDGRRWLRADRHSLAAITGLTADQIKHLVVRLRVAGAIDTDKRAKSTGDQANWVALAVDPCSEPIGRIRPIERANPPEALGESAQSRSGESAQSSSLLDVGRERKENSRAKSTSPTSRNASGEPFEHEFDEVWPRYPRKTNRKGALRAWQARRRDGATVAELAAAVDAYAATRRGQDPKFTMHAATFFGPNERWRDFAVADPDGNRAAVPPPAVVEAVAGDPYAVAMLRIRLRELGGDPDEFGDDPVRLSEAIALRQPAAIEYDAGTIELESPPE